MSPTMELAADHLVGLEFLKGHKDFGGGTLRVAAYDDGTMTVSFGDSCFRLAAGSARKFLEVWRDPDRSAFELLCRDAEVTARWSDGRFVVSLINEQDVRKSVNCHVPGRAAVAALKRLTQRKR